MYIVYIDDSGDNDISCFSAIIVSANYWFESLEYLRGMLRDMEKSDGIYCRRELHATEFVSGRGKISSQTIPKAARCRLFNYVLSAIARMPNTFLINGCSPKNKKDILFEYMLNRINTFVKKKKDTAIIICDEGKNYIKLQKKLTRINYIPSIVNRWQYNNAPTRNIIEDIWHRNSKDSIFIQMSDFCAYALLRRERQIPSKNKYGLNLSFCILERIMVKAASSKDRLGIVRVK